MVGWSSHPEIGLNVVPPSTEISNSTVPVGATGLADPGGLTEKPAFAVTLCPVTDGFTTAVTPILVAARLTVWVTGADVDVVKLESPEYTAWIWSPVETAASSVEHVAVPESETELHVRGCDVQFEMSFHVVPLAEDWKSTVPEGPDGLSVPGAVIDTVALRPTVCPDTVCPGVAITDVVVAAGVTVSVALGEVEKPKLESPV